MMHYAPMTFSPPEGEIEDVRAEWRVLPNDGPLMLHRCWLGQLPLSRDQVSLALGSEELARQEKLATQAYVDAEMMGAL